MVDLPHPDGPSSATISFAKKDRLMLSSTCRVFPLGWGKSTSMPFNSHNVFADSATLLLTSLVQAEPAFGQPVERTPDRAIERHHQERHHQRAGREISEPPVLGGRVDPCTE